MSRESDTRRAFLARDVVRLAGMGSYDTLDYWATRGILEPSLTAASGTGSQRRYSFTDVVAARMAVFLRAQGLGLQVVRRIVRQISKLPRQSLERAWLVVSGHQVFVTYNRRNLAKLLQDSERALLLWYVVCLAPVVREVREAIARMFE